MCKIVIQLVLFLLISTNVWATVVSGIITMEFDLSNHGDNEDVQLWIPYPTSNKYQTISKISVVGDYVESAVYTDNKFQTPMLYARWDKKMKTRKLSFTFKVDRQEIRKLNFPEKETAWDPVDYAKFLVPTKLGPIDGNVKKLADKITKGKITVLEKAKAIYDWTCENTYRNPKTRGCGSGNVCTLLKDPGGKCGDISSIFIALARAAGVPSREVFGIRQGKKQTQDISTWQHCWSEFFLPGYGWVPVDPADVRKMMLKHNLKLSDARTKGYRNYYWGGVDPYRVKLSQGRDLTLNPTQLGDTINYLMYPYAQVGKRVVDWLNPENFKYTITYRQLDR